MANNTSLQMADKLESWAEQLREIAADIRNNSESPNLSHEQHAKLTGTAKDILKTVKQPQERLMESMIVIAELAALRMFIKWKVFEIIPGHGTISYKDLALKLGAETSLITRLAWMLVGTGLLKQVGIDQLAHTETSKSFVSSSPLSSLVENGFDNHLRSLVFMPDYFDKYTLREPIGRYQTIHAFAAGNPDLTVWEHMHRDQSRMASFMTSMVAMAKNLPVVGSYDFSWLLAKAKESDDRVLVVDVGGGQGHALEAIFQATPGLPANRCVVEDLSEVVEAAKAAATGQLASAQFITMDFHSEQPVNGKLNLRALIYYIRRCLHDYGDEDSVKMLKQIQFAMSTDSRVLIVEEVLHNPPSPMASATDIFMATLGGKERTLDNFVTIASEAGLRIVETHRCKGSGIAVIECVKV
ncbi:hypothetical protein G7Z17_g1040 [Cylindrodendrum hubeiense]|uniref:O-methyltransferase n=1 Tax=Cylindrodendrum hubeiense TaxID=595255 RepID=A0A9P5HFP0_9HYPO|nr:hypothetical protein G7Z17_g1040 [Cylindrodendrum hubeiense]